MGFLACDKNVSVPTWRLVIIHIINASLYAGANECHETERRAGRGHLMAAAHYCLAPSKFPFSKKVYFDTFFVTGS